MIHYPHNLKHILQKKLSHNLSLVEVFLRQAANTITITTSKLLENVLKLIKKKSDINIKINDDGTFNVNDVPIVVDDNGMLVKPSATTAAGDCK